MRLRASSSRVRKDKRGESDLADNKTIDVGQAIDAAPVGPRQIAVFVVCGLVALVDGFDTQSIAFAAPDIAAHWSVPHEMFGAAFGAGLLGGLLGGIVLGTLGDRLGRRAMLVLSMVLFALTSYGTATSENIESLIAWRFATGIGLGGAIPNLVAVTAEYAPARHRQSIVTAMFCGFPLGAVIGGAASAKLLPLFGWQSIFVMGAIAPLLLLPLVLLVVPSSMRLMIARGKPDAAVAAVLRGMIGVVGAPEGAKYVAAAKGESQRARVADLLSRDLWVGTLCLWLTLFMSLVLAYSLINWTPLLLRQAGMGLTASVYAAVFLNLGSVAGSVVFSRLCEKLGIQRILPVTYALGAVSVVGLGLLSVAPMTAPVLSVAFVAGAFCLGSQVASIGVIALYYPVHLTGTGVGFTLAVGRVGSFLGPVGAGILLGMGLATRDLFFIAAIPASVAALAILGVALARQRRLARAGAAAGA
jgi:MFS transporter, AAHS family, 4-hydroxybenzoate transporter